MVVLDALHWIQGHEAPDLAVRWNCKAAKCGSCSAEVDGRPSLTCKTRLSDFDLEQPITVEPMRAFPLIRDLVTDVSWNYEVNKTIEPFTAARRQAPGGVALAAGGHRAGPGIPQVHRVLPVPGRLPRPAQPRDRQAVHGAAVPRPGGRPRDAPDRRGGPAAVPQGRRRHRLLQHHEVLHRGLPGAHQDHRQRDHPAQGTRRRRVLRPAPDGVAVPARRLVVIGRRRTAGAARTAGSRRDGDRRGRVGRAPPGAPADATGRPSDARDRTDDRTARRRSGPARPSSGHDPATPRRRRAPPSTAAAPSIRTDGAARGNPGPASPGRRSTTSAGPTPATARPARRVDLGLPRHPDEQRRRVHGGRPGPRARPRARGARRSRLLLDSKLIVEQLAGRWRVKDAKLIPLWAAARKTLAGFDRWSAAHVPRAQNSVADALANEAIDRAQAGGPAVVVRRPGTWDSVARNRRPRAVRRPCEPPSPGSPSRRAHRPGRRRLRRIARDPARPTPSPAARDARRARRGGSSVAGRPPVPARVPIIGLCGRPRAGYGRLQPVRRQLHVRPDDRHDRVRRAGDDRHGLRRVRSGDFETAFFAALQGPQQVDPDRGPAAAPHPRAVRRAGSSSPRRGRAAGVVESAG